MPRRDTKKPAELLGRGLGRREFFGYCATRLLQTGAGAVLLAEFADPVSSAFGMLSSNSCPNGGLPHTCPRGSPLSANVCDTAPGNLCQPAGANPGNVCNPFSGAVSNLCDVTSGGSNAGNTCQGTGIVANSCAGVNKCNSAGGMANNCGPGKGSNTCSGTNLCDSGTTSGANSCDPALSPAANTCSGTNICYPTGSNKCTVNGGNTCTGTDIP